MVNTTDLDEVDRLLVAVRVALTKKERLKEPRSVTVTDPVTGEDVTVDLPELSKRRLAKVEDGLKDALGALKDRVASLK